jgi:hypothetical protein
VSSLSDHLDHKVARSRLKVNAYKSKFCAHETKYLGYILKILRIKPQSNKMEAFLALHPPTNVRESDLSLSRKLHLESLVDSVECIDD